MTILKFIQIIALAHSDEKFCGPQTGFAEFTCIGVIIFLTVKIIIDILMMKEGIKPMIPVILFNLLAYPITALFLIWCHPVAYIIGGVIIIIADVINGAINTDSRKPAALGFFQYSIWIWAQKVSQAMDLKASYIKDYEEHLKTNTL